MEHKEGVIMDYVIIYLLAFFLIYLFYLFTVVLQKKRYEKFKKSNQVMYFVNRYQVDVNSLNMTKFTNLLGLTNAFIVATAFIATFLVDSFLLQLLVGLVVLIPLMLLCYHLIGTHYKKEGRK